MNTIGITMGCPASIGPEIILRYFQEWSLPPAIRPVILGDRGILAKCAADLDIGIRITDFQPDRPDETGAIEVLSLSQLDVTRHSWGIPTRETGIAMADYITTCVQLIQAGTLDAMVTCPISKSSLNQAGYMYPGHTEMLVDLTGASRYTMMMAGATLKVTLATIHCALRDVPHRLNSGMIAELIHITHEALQVDFGIAHPRVAVAGLNPHGGEEGLFGDEETQIILPAIEQARQAGIMVSGPFPPDTIFFKAAAGEYDAVVCMYHDQGLIPFKLLHFQDGVNVTLGLPIVRTSVDHGTAYDIAGQGKADPTSLAAAVKMAGLICDNRRIHFQGIH